MDEKLIEVLDELTWDILEKNPKLENIVEEGGLTLFKADYVFGYGFMNITFMGIDIWCSEDDDREFIKDDTEYEDWKPYFKRKIKELKNAGITIEL
jgi:hypothetical protein